MISIASDVQPASGGPTLADLLRGWRERALLTQEQLARRTGLGVRTVRRLESDGLRRPRGDSIRLLADALELTDAERAELISAARNGGPAPPSGHRPQPGVPRQLPGDIPGFAGRAEQLRQLDALLGAGGGPATVVISAIAGTAGVGKTALAVHWSHRVAEHFPDGQLYVNLHGFDPGGAPTDPVSALRGLLTALGVPPSQLPTDPDALSAMYRSRLAMRRMLVLLDNAGDAGQVRPLLPGTRGCLVLVTSRDRLSGLVASDGAYPLSLDLLSTMEARELVVRRLGAARVAAEPDAVEEIIARTARLPLALAVTAARAATQPDTSLAEIAAELGDAQRRLDALGTGDAGTDVRAVFSWSYRRLSPAAARLFRLLGLHPGPDTGAPAAASLAGLPLADTTPLLEELVRAHLLTEPASGRYAMHDLLRAYTAEQHRTDDQPDAAVRRVLDHYLHSAAAADRELNPRRDPIALVPATSPTTPERPPGVDEALAWFTDECAVLLTAVRIAEESGWDAHCWQLYWALAHFLDWRGHWYDQYTAGASALAAAGRLGDLAAQECVHSIIASSATRLGRYDDAHTHLRHCLDLTERLGNRVRHAQAYHSIGWALERQGRYAEALEPAKQALAVYRTTEHRRGQASSLNTVGWHHALLGQHEQALAHCQQALALYQALDDRHGAAHAWDSVAYAHHHLGNYPEAIACYEQAVAAFDALGDQYEGAASLDRLGDSYRAAGAPEAAGAAWLRAYRVLRELGHADAATVHTKLDSLAANPS